MKNEINSDSDDDPLDHEIDFSKLKGRPNRFAAKLKDSTIVVLDRDITLVFNTAQKVNDALHSVIDPTFKKGRLIKERRRSSKDDIPPERLVIAVSVTNDLMAKFGSPEKLNETLRALIKVKTQRKKSA